MFTGRGFTVSGKWDAKFRTAFTRLFKSVSFAEKRPRKHETGKPESWTTKKVVFHSGNFSKMVHNGRLPSFNSWSCASVYLKPKWLVTELLDPDDLMEDWGYSGTVNNPRFTLLATWNACCTVYRLRAVSFSSDLVSVELSFACLARFARWAKKKERLLLVYTVNSRFLSLVSRPSKKAHLL